MPNTTRNPADCFICDGAKAGHGDAGHTFWSTADARAEAREHDRRVLAAGGPVYSTGARNAEAAYVDTYIGR